MAGTATSKKWALDDMQNLTNIDDLNKAYDQLCKEENVVNQELDVLLEHHTSLGSKMISLHAMMPNFQLLHNDSEQLSSMISFTSTLAENVSSKVRQLDLAKSRVTSCRQRVKDVLELKSCSDGVRKALEEEQYEHAARHIKSFLTLDQDLLRMQIDASEGSTLDTSIKLLKDSRVKLKNIFFSKFDAAVHQGDAASVERFFKIFPLIGENEEGLLKFSKYLASQLSETAEKNLKIVLATNDHDKRANVLYADGVTLLFEGIARVVEIHQPLVETYYGPGRMFIMMKVLQKECDRQARKIMESFKEKRGFNRKYQLVQRTPPSHKGGAMQDKLDPKELDILLAEVTLLNARSELYLRFVRRRITVDMEVGFQEEKVRKEKLAEINSFVNECDLSKMMQELIGSYVVMENYFMKESVVKAVSMDYLESGNLTSSMVDDTFFIVKKCLRRALSSSNVNGVCAMLNYACKALEEDFGEVLFGRLVQGFPSGFDFTAAYNFVQSSFQQGKLQNADVETEKAKTAFLTTLNNTEVSCDFIQKLKTNLTEEVEKLYAGVDEQSKKKLQEGLKDLGEVSNKFKDCLTNGFSQLNISAIKPRIKPWVDTFLTVSHTISEEEFTQYEANDPWVQNFIVNLDSLLVTFKNSLTPSNYDTLVGNIAEEVTTQLKQAVRKSSFNRLGGLQFDKELRSLVAYLSSVTTWTIRDKFVELTQMATILNLESESEILDCWGFNSGPQQPWRLTPAEVRSVLQLRRDFKSDKINSLKL